MHYDPFTSVDNIFNKIEDLLKYGDMKNCPYSHPQANSKAYNILKETGILRLSIKSWNGLPLIQQMWITFKTNF